SSKSKLPMSSLGDHLQSGSCWQYRRELRAKRSPPRKNVSRPLVPTAGRAPERQEPAAVQISHTNRHLHDVRSATKLYGSPCAAAYSSTTRRNASAAWERLACLR